MKSSFWKVGHTPTLLSAFLYFDLSFMVWVLLGPLAVQMAVDLHLTSAQEVQAAYLQHTLIILESTLATQQLWYLTAGLRPKQPPQEREYFENLWKRNFENSDVPDSITDIPESMTNVIPKKVLLRDEVPFKEYDGEILFRGKGPFSNSVSKSFSDHDVAAMTLQVCK